MKWHNKFPHTLDNIKRTFKFTADKLSLDWLPNYSRNGWSSMSQSLILRHRIVHPKTSVDLNISDDEFNKHKEALEWFIETWVEFQQKLITLSKVN